MKKTLEDGEKKDGKSLIFSADRTSGGPIDDYDLVFMANSKTIDQEQGKTNDSLFIYRQPLFPKQKTASQSQRLESVIPLRFEKIIRRDVNHLEKGEQPETLDQFIRVMQP